MELSSPGNKIPRLTPVGSLPWAGRDSQRGDKFLEEFAQSLGMGHCNLLTGYASNV